MWLIYASLSAASAALVAVFGKIGLQKIDSTLATTIRSVIMAAFLIVIALSLKKFQGFSAHDVTSKEWTYITLAGVAGALSWLFYFAALKVGRADAVVAVDRMSILLVAILAALFLGEAFTWKIAAGSVLMVGGAILLSIK